MTKIEEVINGKNVYRQAYHSSSFIGNHCHTILCNDKSYEQVTASALNVARDLGADEKITKMAGEIQTKFTPLFEKFARCHSMFNSSEVVDAEELGEFSTSYLAVV